MSLARLLFAVLALQLAVGWQADAASAATQKVESHAACPIHTPHDPPVAQHDCCKTSGCQCHCGNLPLAFGLSVVRVTPETALTLPAAVTRSSSAPTDTLFRPPIAS